MRWLAAIAVVGLGCQARAEAPESPATVPPVLGSTASDANEVAQADDSGPYSCARLRSRQVSINIRAGYSPADIAAWLMAWSCRVVIVPTHVHQRRSASGYTRLVTARELPRALDELLEGLDLVAVTEGRLTVFVTADKRLRRDKPAIVWSPRNPSAATEADADLAGGIRQLSEGRYEVDRSVLDRLLSDPTEVARGARIIPSVVGGKPTGFKLYAIRPDSIFAKLGLRNGDAIHRVNGQEIGSPDRALEVFVGLRGAQRVTLELTRRGAAVELVYAIK
jgi:general secretion pathway protein C